MGELRRHALSEAMAGNDSSGGFSASARAIRLFLQSAMLALGAWLVLRAELSPGGMIAASIILGRALAPLDQVISGWPQVQAARAARARLRALMAAAPSDGRAQFCRAPRGMCPSRGLPCAFRAQKAAPGSCCATCPSGAAGSGARGDRRFGVGKIQPGRGARRDLAASHG